MSDLVEQIDRLKQRLEGGQQTLTAWHLVPFLAEIAQNLEALEKRLDSLESGYRQPRPYDPAP